MISMKVDAIWSDAVDRDAYTNDATYHADADRVREVMQTAAELMVAMGVSYWQLTRFLPAFAAKLLPDPYKAQQRRIELAARLAEEMNRPVRIPVELVDDQRGALRAQGETITGSQLAEVARKVAESDRTIRWFGSSGARLIARQEENGDG